MRITRIASHPRLERVRIHLDDEEEPRLEIALELALRERLAVGDALDPARLARLEADDAPFRAREAALRLLSHRPRSVIELRRRLERRELPPAAIDHTLAWLQDRGYLDDRAFAEAFARDRLRLRPRGPTGLVRELRARGVDPETAAAAAGAAMDEAGTDERELAIQAAHAWARRNEPLLRAATGREDRLKVRRRLYGHMARRGFSPDAIRAGTDAILGD